MLSLEKNISYILKRIPLLFILVNSPDMLSSQDKIGLMRDSILAEGYYLYGLERSAWLTTDLLRELCPKRFSEVKGYLSYQRNQDWKCIFWSENDTQIVFKCSFTKELDLNDVLIDSSFQIPTPYEMNLIRLRETALQYVISDTTSYFKKYRNANLNLIPIWQNNVGKVFILTGPTVDDVMFFGNDYILQYDSSLNLLHKERIHNNLITIDLTPTSQDSKNPIIGSMHSHVLHDLITSTDVCNLLLYQEYASWTQHYVISDKYVSIWNIPDASFTILTKEAFLKLGKKSK